MPLSIRLAETPEDIVLAFRAYKQMHEEGLAPGRFNARKALSRVMRWINGPGSFVLMAMDGDKVAGVLILVEETYWWNDDTFLADKGLYVLPEYRDGEAFELLSSAAKDAGDDLGIPVVITVSNIKRKRGPRSKWERIGATLGYQILGATIAHTEKE